MAKKTTLTNRELNNIYNNIENKVVDKICNQLIDGYNISDTLKQNIEKSMVEILNNPSTINRLGDIILQNVDVLFRNSVKGPLLLDTLLSDAQSYARVKQMLLKRMENLRVIDGELNMHNIPKQLFNKPISEYVKKGGNKTLRKNLKSNNNTRKIKGGGIGIGSLMEMGNSLNKIKNSASNAIDTVKSDNKLGDYVVNQIKDSAQNAIDTVKSDNKLGDYVNQIKDIAQNAIDTNTSEDNVDSATEDSSGENVQNNTLQTPNIDEDVLYTQYVEVLINRSTKKLLNKKNLFTKKMINATYNYMIQNGDTILTAISNAIKGKFDTIPINIVDIIIDQVLNDSKVILSDSIKSVVTDNKRINDKFEPNNIVDDVLKKTKTIIQGR